MASLTNNDNNNNNNIFSTIYEEHTDYFSKSSIFILRSFEVIFNQFPITLLWILIVSSLLYFFAMVYRNLRFIWVHWIRKPHDLLQRYGANSWVVCTGSSQGIGLGFAVEFAKLGFNIVLMSRSDEHLQVAKEEVLEAGKAFGVQVRTVVIDFSKDSSNVEFWKEKFLKPIEDLDVSVLINNVGMNYTDNFENIDEQTLLNFVSVNCTSQIMATRMLIKKLIARTQKKDENGEIIDQNYHEQGENTTKRSAILSVSSVAGQRPLLYLAPYSATKAFNDYFSRSLSLEYANTVSNNNSKSHGKNDDHHHSELASYVSGIAALNKTSSCLDVLSCRPGYVITNMSQLTEADAGGFVLDKYECARGCMEKLGFVNETYGDVRHAWYCIGYQLLPEFWLRRIRQRRLEAKKAKMMMAAAAAEKGKENKLNK